MILFNLIKVFFSVGLFSFGGGTAMLPIIYQGVSGFGMSWSDFSDMVALSQITPGPVAVNAATYVGLYFAGLTGAVVATVSVCIPCFAIMIIVIRLIDRFKGNRMVEGAFIGIRPVTVGLIMAAGIFVAQGVLVKDSLISLQMTDIGYYNLIPMCIFGLSILLMSVTKMKPIWILLLMAGTGAVIYGVLI